MAVLMRVGAVWMGMYQKLRRRVRSRRLKALYATVICKIAVSIPKAQIGIEDDTYQRSLMQVRCADVLYWLRTLCQTGDSLSPDVLLPSEKLSSGEANTSR